MVLKDVSHAKDGTYLGIELQMVGMGLEETILSRWKAEVDDDMWFTQADEMDNAFGNGLDDNDVSVGNARKQHNSSVCNLLSCFKKSCQYGQAIIGVVETIANGFSEYANKRSKERPSVDKWINNLAELGLPSGLYHKALCLSENERKAEFFCGAASNGS